VFGVKGGPKVAIHFVTKKNVLGRDSVRPSVSVSAAEVFCQICLKMDIGAFRKSL
jgi:hypothetical protein